MSFYKLKHPAMKPHIGSEEAAGLDLRADTKAMFCKAGVEYTFCTGVAFEIQLGWCGLVLPRSGLGVKYRLRLLNTCGVIDSDYRDYVKVAVVFEKDCWLEDYERICQMITVPILPPHNYKEVDELSDTDRGTGGFGSSGRT